MSLNDCKFTGNVGQEPELSFTTGGTAVCKFSIAVNEKWKKDGVVQENTEWIPIVAFNKQAELMAKFLRKGSKVLIQGKYTSSHWQDKEGNKRKSVEIQAFSFEAFDKLPQDDNGQSSNAQQVTQVSNDTGFDDSEDIPFN